MEEIFLKTFDFGIRVVEISNYLEYENKRFPLIERLLECGTGLGVLMRVSEKLPQYRLENCIKALKLALEAEYLLELMVKTSVISEKQSRPILANCRSIRDQLGNMTGDMSSATVDSKSEKESEK
jgi:hypothetical protein